MRTLTCVTLELKKPAYDSRCPMSDPALETRASACILGFGVLSPARCRDLDAKRV